MGDLTGDYAHFTEFCVFAHKGKRDLMSGRPSNVIEARRVPPGQMVHPTEKPIRVLRPLIVNSTEVGETILDPFAGSGSLGVAAKEENREAVLIEKEKKYVEVIEGRLAQGNLF
jgi:DNA modification methylase